MLANRLLTSVMFVVVVAWLLFSPNSRSRLLSIVHNINSHRPDSITHLPLPVLLSQKARITRVVTAPFSDYASGKKAFQCMAAD